MRIERFHDEPLSNQVLKAIEQSWELNLPAAYRSFLLKYNGGLIDDFVFDFKDKSDGSCLTSLFGIVRDFSNNLLLKQKYAGDRVPGNTLPIGRDVYGNLILISVKGPDRGKIYFWDHEMESYEDEEPSYSNLTLIADDFDEFINSLRSPDEAKPSE